MTASTGYAVAIQYGVGTISNTLDVGIDQSSPSDPGNSVSWNTLNGGWTASSGNDTIYYVYVVRNTVATLLEPQYQLANTSYAPGTNLQNFLTSFDPTEWSTTNNYLHAVSAIANSTSTIEIDNTTGPTTITGSSVASPNNYATSTTGICLTSAATLDTKPTNNQGGLYGDNIIVQVGAASTASCAPTGGTPARLNIIQVQVILRNGRLTIQ